MTAKPAKGSDRKPVPASLRPMKMTQHRRAVAKRAAAKHSAKSAS